MMNETLLADDVTEFAPMADYYKTSQTSDGFISIAAATDEHWRGVADVIGRPEVMEDPRFNSIFARSANIAALLAESEGAFLHLTTAQALAALKAHDVPCAECLYPDAVISNEQVNAVGALGKQMHPILGELRTAMPPVQFAGEQGDIDLPCPAHGQHSSEIAGELGYDAQHITAMHEAGILAGT